MTQIHPMYEGFPVKGQMLNKQELARLRATISWGILFAERMIESVEVQSKQDSSTRPVVYRREVKEARRWVQRAMDIVSSSNVPNSKKIATFLRLANKQFLGGFKHATLGGRYYDAARKQQFEIALKRFKSARTWLYQAHKKVGDPHY